MGPQSEHTAILLSKLLSTESGTEFTVSAGRKLKSPNPLYALFLSTPLGVKPSFPAPKVKF